MYELMELGRCKVDIENQALMMVDSLEITDTKRYYIIQKCKKNLLNKLISHMVETAHQLADIIVNKTIVLTSAMIPVKFGSSDELFNMGSALSFVQSLSKGIYISMNGQIFDWENVLNNNKLSFFEELEFL